MTVNASFIDAAVGMISGAVHLYLLQATLLLVSYLHLLFSAVRIIIHIWNLLIGR